MVVRALWVAWLSLGLAAAASEGPALAQDSLKPGPQPDYRISADKGNALYRKGRVAAWTGLALLPVSAVALIPVIDDGAFGITAADPGFSIFFALAGAALIHIGIPIMGSGASRVEDAARKMNPGLEPSVSSIWSMYHQSWSLMAAGTGVLVIALPIAAVAGLDYEHVNGLDYTAEGLGIAGIGLLAAGLIEQDLCWYRFSRSRRKADAALRAISRLSFRPVLRTDKGRFDGMGLRLVEGF